MKKLNIFLCFFIFFFFPLVIQAQDKTPGDIEGLAQDIPEPADAQQELPSPIPVIYEFMGGVMAGDQDRCLVNFHVRTFLSLLFGDQLKGLMEPDYMEIISYHTQVQRNEFRFLSKIMNRLAKEAKLHYSNPRFNQAKQAKIIVKIKTIEAEHEFVIYSRYVDEKWQVYDYVLNNRRFSDAFKNGLAGMKIEDYINNLRPLYGTNFKYKDFSNPDFGINFKLPDFFKVKEKVSQALLFSISAFEGRLLLHVQAAVYQQPLTLNQAATDIRQTIMPFKPKLFDQWKSDIAGVEMGQVIFQFEKSGKALFTHMVIIPMKEKLLVLNFYHSSFQLLKNLSNIRDKIIDNLKFAKLPAPVPEISIPADDATLPGKTPTELQPYKEPGSEEPTDGGETPPPDVEEPPPPEDENVEPPPPPEEGQEGAPPKKGGEKKPPKKGTDEGGEGTEGGEGGQGEEIPPPPPGDEEIPPPPDDQSGNTGGSQENPAPPPPDTGEGGQEGGDAPQPPPDEGGGKDVSF